MEFKVVLGEAIISWRNYRQICEQLHEFFSSCLPRSCISLVSIPLGPLVVVSWRLLTFAKPCGKYFENCPLLCHRQLGSLGATLPAFVLSPSSGSISVSNPFCLEHLEWLTFFTWTLVRIRSLWFVCIPSQGNKLPKWVEIRGLVWNGTCNELGKSKHV